MKDQTMRDSKSDPLREEVLDQYALEGPSPERLLEWVKEFPDFEPQLRAFTEEWEALETLPQPQRKEEEREAEQRLEHYGESLMLRFFAQREAVLENALAEAAQASNEALTPVAEASDVESALVEASGSPVAVDMLLKRAGVTAEYVRRRLGLSIRLWAKLRNGMVSWLSERSAEAIQRIARGLAYLLQFGFDEVMAALPRHAHLPAGNSRADNRPRPGKQQDLYAELESDAGVSDEARRFYLHGEGPPPYKASAVE